MSTPELSPDQQTALNALAELKSVHQGIGAVGRAWRRCKPGTKRFLELEAAYDKLMTQSGELSDKVSNFVCFGFC